MAEGGFVSGEDNTCGRERRDFSGELSEKRKYLEKSSTQSCIFGDY